MYKNRENVYDVYETQKKIVNNFEKKMKKKRKMYRVKIEKLGLEIKCRKKKFYGEKMQVAEKNA